MKTKTMKTCYTFAVKEGFRQPMANLGFGDMAPNQWWIYRINVPQELRGKGYGSRLLHMILDDADRSSVTLRLEVHASGALTESQLISWYMKHGFTWENPFSMIRKPQLGI